MNEGKAYKVRPAGRHILTIGRDLIQDSYAAVVELVKNSYDADSPDVRISFEARSEKRGYSIVVEDHGHGMSRDTVVAKWMVPSTRDKLDRRTSPGGRTMQGRKGVGRYAASILGNDLLLETTTDTGDRTTVYVEWEDFEQAEFLDDVEVLIETKSVAEPPGTKLTIKGTNDFLADWSQEQFNKLRFELKKLISPVSAVSAESEFSIYLEISGFQHVQDVSEEIAPYPIFDLYDYRISGRVEADGKGTLAYQQQKVRNVTDEEITIELDKQTGCGALAFDIRVYDREKEAIDTLIGRGLKDESGNYVGKLQARQLLNEYNGIGVYRNGFRIRPLGDPDFDWLRLNERRVQNPSLRIGSNQVIGFVQIESDEESGLIEKSARDGLRENAAFSALKWITKVVITKLEERRFDYRRKSSSGTSSAKVDRDLSKIFSFDELKRNISQQLLSAGVDTDTVTQVAELVGKDEDDRNKIAEELRQTVAIYQGQATLGKIINVILHEGRRPLNYFRNQIPNLVYWYDTYRKGRDPRAIEKVIPIIEGIAENADFFVTLFERLDPLAAGKRSAKANVRLEEVIRKTLSVFDEEFRSNQIEANVSGDREATILAWPQDLYAIFTNLIDNSFYWLTETKAPERRISIEIHTESKILRHIDYRDTGPGIDPALIGSQVIFEPEFSTKSTGTGLGLAIAGEAAHRSELELRAFESDEGAWFRLQPSVEDESA